MFPFSSSSALSSSSHFVSASRLSLNDIGTFPGGGFGDRFGAAGPSLPPPPPYFGGSSHHLHTMTSEQFSHVPPPSRHVDQMQMHAEKRRRRLASRSVSALNEFDSTKYLNYHQHPSSMLPSWADSTPLYPSSRHGYGSRSNLVDSANVESSIQVSGKNRSLIV